MIENPSQPWLPLEQIEISSLSPSQQAWFLSQDSLTEKLRQRFSEGLTFHLVSAGVQEICETERSLLTLACSNPQWVRIIEWRVAGQVVIAAKTVIPLESAHPLVQKLYTLGEIPIGKELFKHSEFAREGMYFSRMSKKSPCFDFVQSYCDVSEQLPWMRCSVFACEGDRLLVTEAFLPAFFPLVAVKE